VSKSSGQSFRPDQVSLVEYHRFEAASNPSDLSVIYALKVDHENSVKENLAKNDPERMNVKEMT